MRLCKSRRQIQIQTCTIVVQHCTCDYRREQVSLYLAVLESSAGALVAIVRCRCVGCWLDSGKELIH